MGITSRKDIAGIRLVKIATVLIFILAGCFDLDSNLFNNTSLSSYTLPTGVIPASQREEIMMISGGKKIYGYFVRSVDTAEHRIVLYNHGNRDHLQFYWDRVELFYKMGMNVFVYDYQGYGKSEGEPGEAAVYADATAAYHYVRSRNFSDTSIVVYGFSLGGAPATYLAANVFTPRRLILESTFASSTTLSQSGMLLDLPSSFVMEGKYDNAERIKKVTAPLLMLHGVNDRFIDMEKNGRTIFRNANEPKRFIAVAGADHSDLPWKMGEQAYLDSVKNFIHP